MKFLIHSAGQTVLEFYTRYTVEPGYNSIGLSDTSSIASDILWYQLIPHC
jgi:hypothetical protein